jgi:hypothetical protein
MFGRRPAAKVPTARPSAAMSGTLRFSAALPLTYTLDVRTTTR